MVLSSFHSNVVEKNNNYNPSPFPWVTGSRVPARHAEESHPRCQDSREDEAGETGGGRQPDAAREEGQDQE